MAVAVSITTREPLPIIDAVGAIEMIAAKAYLIECALAREDRALGTPAVDLLRYLCEEIGEEAERLIANLRQMPRKLAA